MLQQRTIETIVGIFILAGILALLVLALKVSGLTSYVGNQGYFVTATFDNIGGLKARAPVTVAGVRIGKVVAIDLDPKTYQADVKLYIEDKYNDIPTDSSARILTEGLLGSNYISLSPGFKDTFLKNGGVIENTHPALILENLIGQFLFSMNDKKKS